MKTIGVIGAGVIGRGVAYDFAANGFRVVLVDVTKEILQNSKDSMINDNKLFKFLDKRKLENRNITKILENISFSTSLNDIKDATMVIENVTEDLEVKKDVYKKITEICSLNCIFAVNTSCISITKIQSFVDNPSRVIGIHFMNPVPLKSTVEMIKGYHTSNEVINHTIEILEKCNKRAIIVNDMPGFVSNRVLMLTINEAIFLIQDGVSNAKDIDTLFCECFGHKMGPLATGDLIGLDTILNSLKVLYESFNDSKYRPAPLLVKMVDAGLYGKKSNQGFYKY